METRKIPPRFEDLHPEESETLVKICNDSKFRKAAASICTFISPNAISQFSHNLARTAKGALTRTEDKIGRNDPCPCGKINENGKPIKFKKCCG